MKYKVKWWLKPRLTSRVSKTASNWHWESIEHLTVNGLYHIFIYIYTCTQWAHCTLYSVHSTHCSNIRYINMSLSLTPCYAYSVLESIYMQTYSVRLNMHHRHRVRHNMAKLPEVNWTWRFLWKFELFIELMQLATMELSHEISYS